MGRAGNALKQVLETYGITQYQMAAMIQVNRSNFSRWVSGEREPLAETVADIYWALRSMNREAAKEFIQLYLGISDEDGL